MGPTWPLQLELGTWEPIEVGIGGAGARIREGKKFGKGAGVRKKEAGRGGRRGHWGRDSYPDRAPAFPDWRVWKN